MEFDEISYKLISIIKKYWLPLGFFVLGMIFFVYGLISLSGSSGQTDFADFSSTNSASTPVVLKISVDVEGEVGKPGVYKLSQGSIIQDALVMAKGLSENADREYVSKNINLASRLTDGSKIYIPKVGENVSLENSPALDIKTSGLININSASETELNSLPGVGSVTSQKIINARPYTTVNDLLNKKIVSSKVFEEIKDKISVY